MSVNIWMFLLALGGTPSLLYDFNEGVLETRGNAFSAGRVSVAVTLKERR